MSNLPARAARIASALGVAALLSAGALAEDHPLPHYEAPDDPPGEPALPVPGAPRADVHRLGPFASVQVNVDDMGANIPGDAANEPSLAVDPTNPLRMAIGWRQFDTISSNFRQAGWGFTEDGGRTWTFPGVINPGVFRSDPVLAAATDGTFYYNSLRETFDTDVYTSTDAGQSWGSAVPAWGGDKQWMVVDNSGGPGDGFIHSAWSDFAACCGSNIVTRSIDGAASFESPVSIVNRPRFGTMDVGPDGTVWIIGVDSALDEFLLSRSTNADQAGQEPVYTTSLVGLNGFIGFGGGPNPDGLLGQAWVRVNPTNGHIYALCSVDPPGSDPLDVQFTRSTNGGGAWSTPVTINTDGPGNWQWFGTMGVAPNGRIDVVWNDTRSSGAVNLSQLYYSSSSDGGVTWTPNIPLSPEFDSYLGWPRQNKLGDYYDIHSDLVGADLAWAATFNGEQDVYYLRIGDYDCNGNGVGDSQDIADDTSSDINGNGIPDECEEGVVGVSSPGGPSVAIARVAPNPFSLSGVTEIAFRASRGGRTRLSIYDVDGREVRRLLNRVVQIGEHRVRWDGRTADGRPVAPGRYWARVTGPGLQETIAVTVIE